MLDAIYIPNQPRTADGKYPILRVVAAFPLDVNFGSNSEKVQDALEEDTHPLARLSQTMLASVIASTPEGEAIVRSVDRRSREFQG